MSLRESSFKSSWKMELENKFLLVKKNFFKFTLVRNLCKSLLKCVFKIAYLKKMHGFQNLHFGVPKQTYLLILFSMTFLN